MKDLTLFDYPNYLNNIFDKLDINNIKPIFVGGYVRDYFLNLESKDIDIELFGVNSFLELENILKEFGSVNNVGKSFGVCKLSLQTTDIDFTLPRRDNKVASGHRGFLIQTDKDLDFTTASSRRDFTMNAIGYDVKNKTLLDPFNGVDDIKNKTIKAVNLAAFWEDPLRVFRALAFASRFDFKIDNELLQLCKNMCEENILSELSKERIYSEIKKILLKSKTPSVAFFLLKRISGLRYLRPLDTLPNDDFVFIMSSLDRIVNLKVFNDSTNILLFLSVLCYRFNKQEIELFVLNITNKSKLSTHIHALVTTKFDNSYSDSQLLFLATKVNIEYFLLYSQAIYPDIKQEVFVSLRERALKLNILNDKQEELLKGRDLLAFGIEPSKEYATILDLAYTQQLKLEIKNYKDALRWLKKYLIP